MTKSEVLQCNNPSAIWAAMQANPALKKDRDVWMHLTKITSEEEQKRVKKFFGTDNPDPMAHIDYNKKEQG